MGRIITLSGVGQTPDTKDSGKIIAGVLLACGAGLGIYWIVRAYKNANGTSGVGNLRKSAMLLGDHNEQFARAYASRQLELATQRRRLR